MTENKYAYAKTRTTKMQTPAVGEAHTECGWLN